MALGDSVPTPRELLDFDREWWSGVDMEATNEVDGGGYDALTGGGAGGATLRDADSDESRKRDRQVMDCFNLGDWDDEPVVAPKRARVTARKPHVQSRGKGGRKRLDIRTKKGTQLPHVNKHSTQAELDAAVAALQKATVAVLKVMATAKAAKRCA
tara:strand:- start:305 stop:772 length:468 start_codon:yes stop_codon:yes gene_type:complete